MSNQKGWSFGWDWWTITRVRRWLPLLIFSGTCAAQYVGSSACARCHVAEAAAQSKTGHALSLARSNSNQPGDWAFGAGNQAVTFVSRLNESDYLEHGESWYRASNSMAITPGHQNTDGLRYRVLTLQPGFCDASPVIQQVS